MTANHQLPDQPVRSKGQATLQAAAHPEVFASIRDISPTQIGVLSAQSLSPGTFVRIDIHGHDAEGTVQSCEVQNELFYLTIGFDQPAPPETLS